MTLQKWVIDPSILGSDQPFFKGQKETPGGIAFLGGKLDPKSTEPLKCPRLPPSLAAWSLAALSQVSMAPAAGAL